MEPASANVTTTTLRLERKADPPKASPEAKSRSKVSKRHPLFSSGNLGRRWGRKKAIKQQTARCGRSQVAQRRFHADSVNQTLTIWSHSKAATMLMSTGNQACGQSSWR